MNLLFLYGPAAVGKLTVAQELTERLGYKLLHLHQIFNFLSDIFGIRSPQRWNLGREFRLRIFAEAAKSEINMITTFGGAQEEFDFFDAVIHAVETNGGKVILVQLTATKEELLKRMSSDSRKVHQKMINPEEFEEHIKRFPGVFAKYPTREHLTIDNTDLSPKEVVEKIIAYYSLEAK